MTTNTDEQAEFQLVYQGFDSTLAGMYVRLLEAEGITCRHLGTHFPADVGLGDSGCEQRLEVPVPDVERARELLAAVGADD
jgi:hypothetical protein